MPVTASAIVSAIGGLAIQGVDASKRRQMETNLAFLDNRQKNELQKALASTDDKNKKLEILTNALLNIRSAQSVATIQATIQAKAKRERTLAFAVVGGAVALLIGIIIIKKKS